MNFLQGKFENRPAKRTFRETEATPKMTRNISSGA
jgi:hypothetical protein